MNKRVDTEKMNPSEVVENLVGKKNPSLFSEKDLAEVIGKVIQENPKPVEDYKRGKTAALEFLVGQVAKYTKGQADLTAVRRILGEKLQAIFKTTP